MFNEKNTLLVISACVASLYHTLLLILGKATSRPDAASETDSHYLIASKAPLQQN